MLSPADRVTLLRLAREAVRAAAYGEEPPGLPQGLSPALAEICGAFVTLTIRGRLRGCIGTIEGRYPLAETVLKMGAASAASDPRFAPLTPAEFKEVAIEISVLSPLRRVASADEIRLGEHGVVVKRGGRCGVFLPQVARETGWTKERFLSELCAGKAGLPDNAWQDLSCELYVFTVEILKG